MTENQKLREALRIFAGCATPVDKSIDARGHAWSEAYLDQALLIARQALALPTAALVGERDAFEKWWKGDLVDWRGFDSVPALHAWRAWQARAALSAGDAVDAQRYRYLRAVGGQSWHEVSDPRNPKLVTGSMYDVATDAAMRKGQL